MLIETLITIELTILGLIYLVVRSNKRSKIDFRGKHVVITGGSQGIGKALAIQAVQQGSNVTIIARNKEKLNATLKELESLCIGSTQKVQAKSLDISKNFEDTQQVFKEAENSLGPVDILVNNAGIFKCSEFSQTDVNEFEQQMRTNYIGTVYCTKCVVESMKQRKFGRILFVSSQAGQIGIFGYTAYSATKFALKGFVEALQMELKPFNIFLTLAYPPDTDTPGLKEENSAKPDETRLIAEGSGVLDARIVATKMIKSIQKGSTHCSYGINGFLLTTLSAGCSSVTNYMDTLIEITMIPLCRLAAILLGFYFDRIVKSSYKKKNL